MAAKLKVFRTAIGFHDAYVAAPSKKAALAAWGSDKDLFARGAAELVTDEALMADALAAPGTVMKRLRGTAAEQIAALPPDQPRRGTPTAAPKPKPKPRPSRATLDDAERAMAEAKVRQSEEQADLRRREQALARERQALLKRQRQETDALAAARDAAASDYQSALASWQAG